MGRRIVVVGGGITGLSAAFRLARSGARVTLLERDARVGGVIATHRADGYVLEEGPMTVLPAPPLLALVRDLGLEGAVIAPRPTSRRRYVARDGRMHVVPASPAQFVATRLLSLGGKLRLVSEPLRRRGGHDRETAAAFAERRFGREARDYLVAPFLQGVFAGEADRLGARHALRRLVEFERQGGSVLRGAVRAMRKAHAERKHAARGADLDRVAAAAPAPMSFPRGLGTLTHALRDALGSRVTCGATVERVRRTDDGAWRIDLTQDGCARTLAADGVVLALPAPALLAIDLPSDMRAQLEPVAAVPHATVATLSLAYRREDVASALDGFGVLLPPVEEHALLGVLFASSLFDGRCPADQVLLTCFAGGTRRPEFGALGGDALLAAARRDLETLFGVRGTPLFVRHAQHRDGIPQYGVDHERVTAAAAAAERDWPGLALAGAWREGVSVGDCVAAGARAAERVGAVLRQSVRPASMDDAADGVLVAR